MPIVCSVEEAKQAAREFMEAFEMYKEGYSALLAIERQGVLSILSKWHDFKRERDYIWDQTVGLEAREYGLAEGEIMPLRPLVAFEISGVCGEFDLEHPYQGIRSVHDTRKSWMPWLGEKIRGHTIIHYDSIMSEDYV